MPLPTLTNRWGLPLWNGAAATPWVKVDEILNQLAGLAGTIVCEDFVTASPGGPAEGDVYYVNGTGTGAFAGHNRELAVYTNGAWYFLTIYGKVVAYSIAADAIFLISASGAPVPAGGGITGTPWDFGFRLKQSSFVSEVITKIPVTRNIDVPANFAGAAKQVGVNPAATFDIVVDDDGVTIGNISVSTGGVITLTTVGGTAKVVAAGSIITFTGPVAADGSIAELVIGIPATVQ